MVVKTDPELRELAEAARLAAQDANGGRYTLADHRAYLDARLDQHPEILARHRAEFVDFLVRDSDERATKASQLSLLDSDDSIESEVWALGDGQRVRAGDATYRDLQRRALVRKSNVDRVLASHERQEAEDAALAPYFTSPATTVAEARSAYLSAVAEAA